MFDSAPLGPAVPIILCVAAATWMLRKAWRMPAGKGGAWVAGGWALIAASLIWPAWMLGPARGPFIALVLFSTAALMVVASGYVRRVARVRAGRESLAPEPSDRATTKWREMLRWLLAGPIGMIAAMAVGIAYSALVPGEPQTRLVMGGLIVPIIWGGAMAWTLADDRIIRATAVLAGVAVAGFAAAILKGFN